MLLIISLNFSKEINSSFELFISSKCSKKISFLIFVEGYLFSLKRWYIKAITPLSGLSSFKFIPKDLLIGKNSSMNMYIMNFFSIDCSTEIGSLFVKIQNKTFSKVLQSDKSNNDLLMKQILDFFEENKIKFNNISKIFVNQGPGNFSGLRGSLAIAKGISIAENLHLIGYNTFIWSCAKYFDKADFICCLIKFREKYYIKEFDKRLNNVSNICEIQESEIVEKYAKKIKIVPKKVLKNFNKKILKLDNLNIVDLDHMDLETLQLNGLLEEKLIKPLYLN